MSQHIIPLRANIIVFVVLLALLGTTLGANAIDLGKMNLVLAMAIAATKAILIMLYFMHIRFANRLTWVFSGAAFFWLGIMIIITLSDYATREWVTIPGK